MVTTRSRARPTAAVQPVRPTPKPKTTKPKPAKPASRQQKKARPSVQVSLQTPLKRSVATKQQQLTPAEKSLLTSAVALKINPKDSCAAHDFAKAAHVIVQQNKASKTKRPWIRWQFVWRSLLIASDIYMAVLSGYENKRNVIKKSLYVVARFAGPPVVRRVCKWVSGINQQSVATAAKNLLHRAMKNDYLRYFVRAAILASTTGVLYKTYPAIQNQFKMYGSNTNKYRQSLLNLFEYQGTN